MASVKEHLSVATVQRFNGVGTEEDILLQRELNKRRSGQRGTGEGERGGVQGTGQRGTGEGERGGVQGTGVAITGRATSV